MAERRTKIEVSTFRSVKKYGIALILKMHATYCAFVFKIFRLDHNIILGKRENGSKSPIPKFQTRQRAVVDSAICHITETDARKVEPPLGPHH